MSWTDLEPMPPTPRNLLGDLAGCWRSYVAAGIRLDVRLAFLVLRVGQRAAYWYGWQRGGARS